MSSYVPADLRRLVRARAERLCEYCLIHEDDTCLGCQVEHIISEKHSGPTVEGNLALACVFCNRAKGTDIAGLATATGGLCRLFNPRIDNWREHFFLEGTHIVGRTDIGTATASVLGFNVSSRLLEREEVQRAGRYPSAAARRRMTKA